MSIIQIHNNLDKVQCGYLRSKNNINLWNVHRIQSVDFGYKLKDKRNLHSTNDSVRFINFVVFSFFFFPCSLPSFRFFFFYFSFLFSSFFAASLLTFYRFPFPLFSFFSCSSLSCFNIDFPHSHHDLPKFSFRLLLFPSFILSFFFFLVSPFKPNICLSLPLIFSFPLIFQFFLSILFFS